MTQEQFKELLRSQQGELNAVLMYQRLAKVVKSDKEREAFLQLAKEEGRHASVFHAYTKEALKPKKTMAVIMPLLYRILGKKRLYKLIAKGEYDAATVGLSFQDSYYKELQDHYMHMKQLFCDGLRQFGLDFTDPQGAYYVLLDVSKYGVKDDLHFCEWLAEHVGVGAVPGSCFFREDVNHLIRFHFAKRDDTLKAALNRLSELELKAKTYKQ